MGLPPGVTPLAEPRCPPHVADHELLRRIGGGSYGEVWLAQNVMGAYRAVKVVYRTGFEADRPFEREFEGIKRFEPISRLHETQVDILHVGRSSDCFYYVMELADDAQTSAKPQAENGKTRSNNHPQASVIDPEHYVPKTLRTELQHRGKLPFEECLEVALSLTTALEHLHSHQLVHRDIKPSNIIFINGTPKLADIGLVTGVDATRSYVGTEGYIPPEGAGTPQADLYSLGKVLYEMSTGMDRQDFPEPPAFWEESADESAWLEFHEILLRACETEPRRRYPSAGALRADLEVLQAGKSVRHLRTLERRLAVLTRFGLAAVLFSVLAAAAYLFSAHETRQARSEAQRADQEAARARRALWDSYLAQAQALRRSGLAGRRFDSLDAIKKARAMGATGESLIQLRNEAIACLALADFQTAKEWSGLPNPSFLGTFDHALERYAYATDKGDVSVRNVADAKELLHLPGEGIPANAEIAFSPDGRLLAVFHGADELALSVWQLQRQAILLKTTGIKGRCFDFSPDSHSLALAQHDGPILIYELASGQCTNRLKQGPLPYYLTFSPDQRELAVSVENLAQVRDLQTGAVLYSFPHPDAVTDLDWHPHEHLLATGCNDQKVRVWNTTDGSVRVLAAHQAAVHAVAFNHSGDLLASSGFDMTTRLWDAHNWRLVVTKPGIGLAGKSPFALDDNGLCYGFHGGSQSVGRLGICSVAPGRECRQLWLEPNQAERTESVDFSLDGRELVSAHEDGARIWELGTGKLITLLPDTNVSCVHFSQQGTSIFTSGDSGTRKWLRDAKEPAQFSAAVYPFMAEQTRLRDPFSLTSDGRTLAINSNNELLLFDAATGQVRPPLSNNAGFYRCALSPDGRWVAGAALPQTLVRVWDLAHTNVLHDLPCEWVSCLAFSPDGQHLITGSAYEYRTWDTHSWRCWPVVTRSGIAYNSRVAFAPDGRLMAITVSAFTLRLLEIGTGRELASFDMPEPQVISCLAFSPDGDQLVVGGQTPVIYVWNLRLIRQELAAMQLDWD